MLAKGYGATTVEEICAAAEVARGGFFHHFKGKEDLALHLLDFYEATTQGMMASLPLQAEPDPLARLLAYIDFFIGISSDPQVPKSCLFGNFAQEVAGTHPDLQERCGRGLSDWTLGIAADLRAARDRHVPGACWDPEEVAWQFTALYEGTLILIKATGRPELLASNMLHYRRYVESLFPPVEEK